MITFIGNVQRKGIQRDGKYCLPRSRAGVGEGLLSGDVIPLWGGQQVMELDGGGSSAALNAVNATNLCMLKWLAVNFMFCGFYLS